MASEGPNDPGTASVSSSGQPWSNPSNILTNGGGTANATVSDTNSNTEFIEASNFGFSIPNAATILGFKTEINCRNALKTIGTEVQNTAFRIVTSTITGDLELSNPFWPDSLAYLSYGGPTQLYGQTWTPADVNGSDLKVKFQALFRLQGQPTPASGSPRVDHVRLTVFYNHNKGLFTQTQWVGV